MRIHLFSLIILPTRIAPTRPQIIYQRFCSNPQPVPARIRGLVHPVYPPPRGYANGFRQRRRLSDCSSNSCSLPSSLRAPGSTDGNGTNATLAWPRRRRAPPPKPGPCVGGRSSLSPSRLSLLLTSAREPSATPQFARSQDGGRSVFPLCVGVSFPPPV